MKKILLVLFSLILLALPCQANEQHAVASFKDMVSSVVNSINESYSRKDYVVVQFERDDNLRIYYDYWKKFRFDELQYGYDVVKTDSLMHPYKGILDISHLSVDYTDKSGNYAFKTKEEAERATIEKKYDRRSIIYRYIYQYNDGKWEFVKELSYLTIFESDSFKNTREQYQPLKRLLVKELWKNEI